MKRFNDLQVLFDRNKANSQRLNEFVTVVFSRENFSNQEVFEEFIKFCFTNPEIRENFAPKIIERINDLPKNIDKKKFKDFLFIFLKEMDPEIDCSAFYGNINYRLKKTRDDFILSEDEVIEICEFRLKRYCSDKDDPVEAFSLLYVCWDFVDEGGRINLTKCALKIIRQFIDKIPYKYLQFIVRSKYLPAMSEKGKDLIDFVFEPFTEAIFGSWDNFSAFLHNLKPVTDLEQELLNEIKELFSLYKEDGFRQISLPKSKISHYQGVLAIYNNHNIR